MQQEDRKAVLGMLFRMQRISLVVHCQGTKGKGPPAEEMKPTISVTGARELEVRLCLGLEDRSWVEVLEKTSVGEDVREAPEAALWTVQSSLTVTRTTVAIPLLLSAEVVLVSYV